MLNLDNEVLEAIITAENYMGNIRNGIDLIVNSYRGGNYYKAKENMKDLVEGLVWLNEVLTYTKSYHSINPLDLSNIFNEMVIAFENTDTVMLADLLEYEVLPIIEAWQGTLKKEVKVYVR